MTYGLFLDDYRLISNSFYIQAEARGAKDIILVKNYEDFMTTLSVRGMPVAVSFDHDLADTHYEHMDKHNYDSYKEKTGYHCAQGMIEYLLDFPNELPENFYWTCHSMNPAGKENIEGLMISYFKMRSEASNN